MNGSTKKVRTFYAIEAILLTNSLLVKPMAKFKFHKLVLSRFQGYPEWYIRIVEAIDPKENGKTRNCKYLVFCYGTHNTQFLNESQIFYFKCNKADAMKNSRKGVKGAFEELVLKPDICKDKLKG